MKAVARTKQDPSTFANKLEFSGKAGPHPLKKHQIQIRIVVAISQFLHRVGTQPVGNLNSMHEYVKSTKDFKTVHIRNIPLQA